MALENRILARNVRLHREARGLTQCQLAEMAGVRTASISDIEREKGDPKLSTLQGIANSLGIPLAALHIAVESQMTAEVA